MRYIVVWIHQWKGTWYQIGYQQSTNLWKQQRHRTSEKRRPWLSFFFLNEVTFFCEHLVCSQNEKQEQKTTDRKKIAEHLPCMHQFFIHCLANNLLKNTESKKTGKVKLKGNKWRVFWGRGLCGENVYNIRDGPSISRYMPVLMKEKNTKLERRQSAGPATSRLDALWGWTHYSTPLMVLSHRHTRTDCPVKTKPSSQH